MASISHGMHLSLLIRHSGLSAPGRIPSSVRASSSDWVMGFGPRPFSTTPDIVIRPAVSPSLEIVLRVRVSALKIKDTNELFILSKRFAIIVPPNVIAIRMLVPPRLPIAPNGSLRLASVLFCDEDVGAFVGEDVFPSAPDTSILIVWPHELPSVVLSPRAVWPSWRSIRAPW